MSTLVVLQPSPAVWQPPPVKPLDEAMWQAWMVKGRRSERRGSAARVKAVKWVCAASLLAAASLWSLPTPYDVVVRFIVAAGAMVMMFQAFRARQFAFAVTFGALALLYNPVAPVLSFSGEWQRMVVAASAVPFIASIAWPRVKQAHND